MLIERSTVCARAERDIPLLDVEDVEAFVAAAVRRVRSCELVPLAQARGRVLAQAVLSPMALPPFDHAAVDGFALTPGDLARIGEAIPVEGRIRAGDPAGGTPMGALRILTGAPVPPGTAAVVMQEHVARAGGAIRLAEPITAGANIRRIGEDVAAGEDILPAGQALDVRHLALLAALGVDKVSVTRRPTVAILALGNELVAPGAPRAAHQIYDSNSTMAAAYLERHGCDVRDIVRAPDDPSAISAAIEAVAGTVDLLVTSGGMAAGDEDHARRALVALGGSWSTLGVKMKPGKPAAFGEIGGTTVLGLPGNPFAALIGLLVIGWPILAALDGRLSRPRGLVARAGFDLDRPPGRAEFFPAQRIDTDAQMLAIDRLGKGGSARLKPLANADGLGLIGSERASVRRGEPVAYHPLESLF